VERRRGEGIGWRGANEWNRFVSPDIQKKYDLELPEYQGIDQVVEVGSNGQKL
jgi:hypothetical protein